MFTSSLPLSKCAVFKGPSKTLSGFVHVQNKIRRMSRSLVALWRKLRRRMNRLRRQMEELGEEQWPRQRWN